MPSIYTVAVVQADFLTATSPTAIIGCWTTLTLTLIVFIA